MNASSSRSVGVPAIVVVKTVAAAVAASCTSMNWDNCHPSMDSEMLFCT